MSQYVPCSALKQTRPAAYLHCSLKWCLILALVSQLSISCANAQDSTRQPVEAPLPFFADEPTETESQIRPAVEAPRPSSATSQPQSAPVQATVEFDKGELETFIDAIMSVEMKSNHIAGATISFVVDNKVYFQKGYGFANVAEQKHVSADETMFRIGSVSKLLTWVAVMQLVEQGKLSLDEDVNSYLKDFQIPATFEEPIKMKHLMTHTPGFEDRWIGLFGRDADSLKPLSQAVSEQIPHRIFPPGELASYSNYGSALAGYIVEVVSGEPWEEYLEKHIFEPLKMTHSTVRQPIPNDLAASFSTGYKFSSGAFEEEDFEFIPWAPAGSASCSADDMARFMIMLLNEGTFDGQSILKPETVQQMLSQLFTHDQRLDGMAHGFWEMKRHGQQIYHHGGDTELFHSFFVMIPNQRMGYFVSYNTDSAGSARNKLHQALLDRYFPVEQTPPLTGPADFESRADRFVGDYEMLRHPFTTPARLGSLLSVINISSDENELVMGNKRFAEIEPLLFQQIDGESRLAFRENDAGVITHLFIGDFPAGSARKLAWHESPQTQLVLLLTCVTVFLMAVIGWPVVAFVTRGRKPVGRRTFMSGLASFVAWVTSILFLAYIAMFVFIFATEPEEIRYAIPATLQTILQLSPGLAGLTFLIFLFSLSAWGSRYWRLTGRMHYTAVMLSCLAMTCWLHYWNLMPIPIENFHNLFR